jgi:hypothetical protein
MSETPGLVKIHFAQVHQKPVHKFPDPLKVTPRPGDALDSLLHGLAAYSAVNDGELKEMAPLGYVEALCNLQAAESRR